MSFYQQLHAAIHSSISDQKKNTKVHPTYEVTNNGGHQIPTLRISFPDQQYAHAFMGTLNDCGVNKTIESDHQRYYLDLTLDEVEKFSAHRQLNMPINFSLKIGDKFNPSGLTAAEQAALDLIKNHCALVKVISDMSYDENGKATVDFKEVDFFLNQMADPTNNRPSRSDYYYKNLYTDSGELIPKPEVVNKLNLETNKVHQHKLGACRDTKHKDTIYLHTPKTSTSLYPTDTVMEVFDTEEIGFLWDINACNIKSKYIFFQNAGTNGCGWLDFDSKVDTSKKDSLAFLKECFATLETLRDNNNKAVANHTTILWNELLAGLPEKRIDAIFSPQDTLEMRLRAWNVMLHAKEVLKFKENIPVLVMEKGKPVRVYTAADREKDLQALARQKYNLFADQNSWTSPQVLSGVDNVANQKKFLRLS